MKTIPSPEFRKTYQRLTERVVVTVHGHPIGVWEPFLIDKAVKVGKTGNVNVRKEGST